MFDFDKLLTKEKIKELVPAIAEAIAIINGSKPQKIVWRKKSISVKVSNSPNKGFHSELVEIEYALKEISDYMVCLVKADGAVGISYCHYEDRTPYFNPEKSIKLAYDRRKIKQNKEIEIFEEYIETEYLYFADSKCPHKLVKALKRGLNQ